MKTITILIAMLFSTIAFANDYAPERKYIRWQYGLLVISTLKVLLHQ